MSSAGNISLNKGIAIRGAGGASLLNGKSKMQNAMAEIGGFGIAEVGGAIVSVGAVYCMQLVPDAILDPLITGLGKIIEPFQPSIEKGLKVICKLEECQPDESKPVSERAKKTARATLIAVPTIAAAWFTKLLLRRWMNKKWDLLPDHNSGSLWKVWEMTPEEKLLFMGDEGVHVLSALAMQNNPASKHTDELIRNISATLQGTMGMSKQHAHDLATMIALHEIPNLLGAASAATVIYGRHMHEWPSGWIGKVLGKRAEEVVTAHTI